MQKGPRFFQNALKSDFRILFFQKASQKARALGVMGRCPKQNRQGHMYMYDRWQELLVMMPKNIPKVILQVWEKVRES